jgi:uncharacterized protein YdaU (DUF1376 family)
MSKPWMPLYLDDYLGDTGHFRAAEHGAYLLLIMHYWKRGGLPDDDRQLATIARMTPGEWRKARPLIAAMFQSGWRHKRVDEELERAAEISGNRSDRARSAAQKRWAKPRQDDARSMLGACLEHARGNACDMLGDAQSTVHSKDGGGDDARATSAISVRAFDLTTEILSICGKPPDDPMAVGGAYQVQSWLNEGCDPAIIMAAVRKTIAKKRDGPPSSIAYFSRPVAHEQALARAPTPLPAIVIDNSKPETVHVQQSRPPDARPNSIAAAGRRRLAELAEWDRQRADQAGDGSAGDGEGNAAVRQLPAR